MFKDFAAYTTNPATGTSFPDPVVSLVRGGIEAISGGVGESWSRVHITFTPDRDSKYMVPAARVTSPAADTVGSEHLTAQNFAKWQLERNAASLPTSYSPAREVQVVVLPDRLNLVSNPSFETFTAPWAGTNCTLARDNTQAVAGSWSMRMTASAAGTMSSTNVSFGTNIVMPGHTYTAQAQFRAATAGRTVSLGIRWLTSAGALLSTSTGATKTDTTTGWVLATVTATAPATAVKAEVIATVAGVAIAEQHYLDAVLMEEGSDVLPYFDGASGDDYLWEGIGQDYVTRSYYYEKRLDRVEAVRRAIRDAVPLGIGVAEPRFGVWTN